MIDRERTDDALTTSVAASDMPALAPHPAATPRSEPVPPSDPRRAAATFPFVVGVGRSGTTLLRTILDAHPDLAVVHESRFVGWMAQNSERYEADGGFSTDLFLADLLDGTPGMPSRIDAWVIPPESIRAAVSSAVPRSLAEAVRVLYGAYAAHHGKGRYADKTPGYIKTMRELCEVFPEARFVHLVRDGRDVALSMMEVDFGGVNIPHAAWLWSQRVRAAQRAGAALGPGRYLVVRYEELIDSPAPVVTRICEFLQLPFDAAMLRYFEAPERISAGLGRQEHHDHVKLPPTAGLRDWRTQMTSAEVARFESIGGDVLVELGYELDQPAGRAGVATRALVAEGRAMAAWRAKQRVRLKR